MKRMPQVLNLGRHLYHYHAQRQPYQGIRVYLGRLTDYSRTSLAQLRGKDRTLVLSSVWHAAISPIMPTIIEEL